MHDQRGQRRSTAVARRLSVGDAMSAGASSPAPRAAVIPAGAA